MNVCAFSVVHRRNFLKVNVYYEDLTSELVKDKPDYEVRPACPRRPEPILLKNTANTKAFCLLLCVNNVLTHWVQQQD